MNEPIRVLQVTPSLSRLGGGVSTYLWGLARALEGHGVSSIAAGIDDEHTEEDTAGIPGDTMMISPALGPRSLSYSPEMGRRLRAAVREADVVHVHGLRSLLSVQARRAAERAGVPLVISTHGMLTPWLLKHGSWRVRAANLAYENRNVRAASCLHATGEPEAVDLRAYGLTNPIAVVPIGIDTAVFTPGPRRGALEQRWPDLLGKKWLLYLGMYDRKKGLIDLARVWGRCAAEWPGWHLVYAGRDIRGHRREVEQAVREAGVGDRVTFIGPVYGDQRLSLFSSCELYLKPSYWENFGIAIAEALASGRPALATRGAPWQDLEKHGCGWWIAPGEESLAQTLRDAMSLTDEERTQMGVRGRRLIEQSYDWPALAGRMRGVYDWLLGRADRPWWVRINA